MNALKEDLRLFFKELNFNKKDLWAIFLLMAVFLFFLYISWLKWGNPIVDCGREPFIAQQLLTGKKLYTEVYYVYGPIIPYLLSLLFYIFGIHLNVIFVTGIILDFLTLILLYIVARTLLNQILTTLFLSIIIIAFCFNPVLFNFIFPYTYTALLGIFLSILFVFILILHLKTKNINYLYFCDLVAGLSIINKFEFGFAFTVLIIFYILINKSFGAKSQIQFIFLNLFIILLIPVLTVIFFLNYLDVDQVTDFIKYLSITINSEPSSYFINTLKYGKFIDSLPKLFSLMIYPISVFLIVLIIGTFINKIFSKRTKFFNCIIIGISLLLVLLFQWVLNTDILLNIYQLIVLLASFLPLLFIFILLFFFYQLIIKKIKPDIKLSISIIIIALTLLLNLRFLFNLNIAGYGVYSSPLSVLLVIYFMSLIPESATKNGSILVIIKYSLFSMILSALLFVSLENYNIYCSKQEVIKTYRGELISDNNLGVPLYNLIEVINKTTRPKDKILLLPEETLIYFLTDRNSISQFHDFLPFRFPTKYLEMQFIETIKNSNVDLIAISNRSSPDYKYKYWGVDYSQTTYDWITQNYELCGVLGNYQTTKPYVQAYGLKIYQKQCRFKW